jgi:hypothetical protein
MGEKIGNDVANTKLEVCGGDVKVVVFVAV